MKIFSGLVKLFQAPTNTEFLQYENKKLIGEIEFWHKEWLKHQMQDDCYLHGARDFKNYLIGIINENCANKSLPTTNLC